VIIESHEEEEVLNLVKRLSKELGQHSFCWTVTQGLVDQDPYSLQTVNAKTTDPQTALQAIKEKRTSAIYVLADFHPYLENEPRVVRLLKEIALGYDDLGHTIILLSHHVEIPEDLRRFSARFEMPIPDRREIEQIVTDEAKRWVKIDGRQAKVNRRALGKLVRNLGGLTATDVRRLARGAISDDGVISERDIPEVNRAKYRLLDSDGLLSFEYETAPFAHVGDLSNLKSWLASRKSAFLQEENVQERDVPKGILLVGVQGTGKSLAARAVAGIWGLPLLRLDFAVLYNKYFGETERNLRQVLKLSEAMAPCVLWIDEIEKGIATGDYDSGTSRRVLGTFLTWLAERKKLVFITATANDIPSLPPELLRKGRMDEIFFVDLPDREARDEILRIHLTKRELEVDDFDVAALAKATEGFSGAELEQAVVSGLYRSKAAGEPLETEHVLAEIESTSPLSVVMAERVAALRRWAKGRAVRAN